MIVIHLRNFCFICCVNLLDTGAGNNWSYEEIGTGEVYNRSEGLAIASLDTFKSGIFYSQENHQFNAELLKLNSILLRILTTINIKLKGVQTGHSLLKRKTEVTYIAGDISYQVQESAKNAQLRIRIKQEMFLLPIFENYMEGGNEMANKFITTFVILDGVIKVINRRVNAIEHVIIPRLENAIRYNSELDEKDLEEGRKVFSLLENAGL
nr:3393_t:CDS:2 [Entrophospora candida]